MYDFIALTRCCKLISFLHLIIIKLLLYCIVTAIFVFHTRRNHYREYEQLTCAERQVLTGIDSHVQSQVKLPAP